MEGMGRARGRARGRAQAAQQPAPPAQRGPRAPASVVSSGSSSTQSSAPPVGRSTARSQAAISDVSRQIQQLSVQSGNGGNGSSGDGNGDGNGNGDRKPIGRGNIRAGRFVDASPLYTRPASVQNAKKGKSGQLVKIQTNFFKLSTTAQWILYKHHVDFEPPEDRTFMRKVLLRNHTTRFGGHLFDGSKIFSIAPLCPENRPLELYSQRESDQQNIRITVKRVGTCESGDYENVQVFNIILRKCLATLKLELIRRNYYDPKAKISIPEYKLELWPGYITSIGQYEYDILLHAEINFKVLRKDTAYELFKEYYRQNVDVKKGFSNAIIGCVILTQYNNKTYRIDDVDFSSSPKATFQRKSRDGVENVTFLQYFESTYGVRINDHNQPMLVSRSSARARRSGQPELIYLVPELCVMTGLTDEMRANYQLMRAQAAHTAVGPGDRAGRIVQFGRRLTGARNAVETLKQWGMNLVPQLVEVDGRVLPQEDIYMANRVQFKSGPDVDWTRNLRTNEMLHTVTLKKWLLVFPGKLEQQARALFQSLQQVGTGMKFQIPTPNRVCLPNDHASAYIQEIERGINEHNPQLVVCVVPNSRSDRYSAIKKKCILDRPVPSQVVLLKSITAKGAMSIATKIAIQINCKIGGAPWSVSVPLEGLMVVGYDVCHDPKDKRKSYGAMVATLDKSLARYFSTVKHHTAGEELSTNFGLSIKDAVSHYYKINNILPKKIVIYRDGVGDGNLRYVVEQEVGNMKKTLASLYEKNEYPLQLAFVVVSKRINVRLFNGRENPRPGTIVDDVITNPRRYDFYLVSQSVRQGTVSPTHYNIIEDTCGLPPDHMQRLTYKLTHMYFNWSGTVRVPAPCQYAHKLAFLTAQSVGADHANLNNFLYFL